MTPNADGEGLWGAQLRLFDSLPSTNQWMLDHIRSCRHGDVVRAIRQTAGRGRFQRQWVTPDNRCLTFSVLLDFGASEQWMAPVCGQAAAVAVHAAVESCGVPALLKWPNDVLGRHGKIAGILAERDADSGRVVLGIGINVNLTGADLAAMELLQPATSIRVEAGREFDVEAVLTGVLKDLAAGLDQLRSKGIRRLIESWRERDALTGTRVTVNAAGAVVTGRYAGLDGDGRLCLVDDAGKNHAFWAGDVSIRGPVRSPGSP